MEPTTILPVISLLLLVSVEYSGWSLLGFLTGRGQLGQFREQFFRAGHAHAGVWVVLSLVALRYVDEASLTADCSDVGLLSCSIDLPPDCGSFLSPLWYPSTPSYASMASPGSISTQHAVRGDEVGSAPGLPGCGDPDAVSLLPVGALPGGTELNAMIYLAYVAGLVLAVGLLMLGVGLIRGRRTVREPA
jgi:hypothetical protein